LPLVLLAEEIPRVVLRGGLKKSSTDFLGSLVVGEWTLPEGTSPAGLSKVFRSVSGGRAVPLRASAATSVRRRGQQVKGKRRDREEFQDPGIDRQRVLELLIEHRLEELEREGGMEETQCSLSKSDSCDEGFEEVTFRWPVEYYEKFRRLGVEIDPWE